MERILDDSKKNFNSFHDAYLRQYIQQADTKASWLFAANSAVIIWIIGNQQFVTNIKSNTQSITSFLIVLACFSFVASCAFLFDAIRPRSISTTGKGIIYFHHVDNLDSEASFIEKVEQASDEEIFRERLKAQFAMSKICAAKYRRIHSASLLSVVALSIVIGLHFFLSFLA